MNDQNRIRMKALLETFGVPISVAAKTIGVSRPLLSRVLSGDDRVDTNRVWALCEQHLSQIVALRTHNYLDLVGVPMKIVQTMQRNAAA